jgi:hypothetical protein
MATRTRVLISLCWIAVVLLAFFVADASSVRSLMYLTTVALVPPIVVNGVWRTPSQTIAEAIREGRS